MGREIPYFLDESSTSDDICLLPGHEVTDNINVRFNFLKTEIKLHYQDSFNTKFIPLSLPLFLRKYSNVLPHNDARSRVFFCTKF